MDSAIVFAAIFSRRAITGAPAIAGFDFSLWQVIGVDAPSGYLSPQVVAGVYLSESPSLEVVL